jgi:hypothetical protein
MTENNNYQTSLRGLLSAWHKYHFKMKSKERVALRNRTLCGEGWGYISQLEYEMWKEQKEQQTKKTEINSYQILKQWLQEKLAARRASIEAEKHRRYYDPTGLG